MARRVAGWLLGIAGATAIYACWVAIQGAASATGAWISWLTLTIALLLGIPGVAACAFAGRLARSRWLLVGMLCVALYFAGEAAYWFYGHGTATGDDALALFARLAISRTGMACMFAAALVFAWMASREASATAK